MVLYWLAACAANDRPAVTSVTPTGAPTGPAGVEPGPEPPAEILTDGSALAFEGAPPTNLFVVSLDTARRDAIGRYGALARTPNLDARLAEGVALDDHRSCSSWTAPSMTCVVTGQTPLELDWWPNSDDAGVPGAHPDLPTLAGALTARGYATTLITANTRFGAAYDLDAGFTNRWPEHQAPADVMVDRAVLSATNLLAGGTPYYLHVHFMDPHATYCPPEGYTTDPLVEIDVDMCTEFHQVLGTVDEQSAEWQAAFRANALTLYAGELAFWDAELGRMWQELDALGFFDDTLVLFVTDHGEQFAERGQYEHGHTLYAEENRAAAMFWSKNIVPRAWAGGTVHEDLAATLIAYFDLPLETSGVVVGSAPPERVTRSMLYWGPGSVRLAVARGAQQLTYDFWGEKHLWDHALDPTGTVDHYDPADPVVKDLWGPMQAFVDEVLATWPTAAPANGVGP